MASLKPIEKSSTDPPVLAIFPSGIPSCLESNPDFKFQVYQNTEQRKSKQAMLYGETQATHFVGTNVSNDTNYRPPHNFAIGVFNPGKQSVKITSANLCFTVQERNNLDIAAADDTITQADYGEVRTQLTERFGSLKRRKELRSQAANKVDIESSEAAAFAAQAAMESASVLAESKSETSDEHPLLPTFNPATSDPEQVYAFSNMLPESLWKSIPTKPLTDSTQSHDELSQMFPAFVVQRVERLRILTGKEKESYARMLMYFTYLMLLYRVRTSSEIRSYLGCSGELAEYLAELFDIGPTKDSGLAARTKIRIHLCIMALKCNPQCVLGEGDIQAICQDMRTTTSELLPFFRAVGCTTAKKERCALSAPLKLPKLGDEFGRR